MKVQTDVSEEGKRPLRVSVTVAGRESLILRTLIRQVIPILKAPESLNRAERLQLAQTLTCALGTAPAIVEMHPPAFTDADAPLEDPDYEPGCILEDGFQ